MVPEQWGSVSPAFSIAAFASSPLREVSGSVGGTHVTEAVPTASGPDVLPNPVPAPDPEPPKPDPAPEPSPVPPVPEPVPAT
jgi:hypothetical protein